MPSSSRFRSNPQDLARLYDDQARDYYNNFNKSLAQIPCDTTGTAQYSLARTCAHCAADYKTWLCTVLMPRCESFDATLPFLQERNIGASFPNGSTPYAANNASATFGEEKIGRAHV